MLPLYIVVLLAASAFSSDFPCKDGVKMTSTLEKNPAALIGNWSYVYHWDDKNNLKDVLPPDTEELMECPHIDINFAKRDFVKDLLKKCGKQEFPFKEDDVMLKLSSPLLDVKDVYIFVGEKENWMMADCKKVFRMEIRKVSDDVILMVNPDVAKTTELLSRKPVRDIDMDCLAKNVDVGEGMHGIGMCF